jgi:chemotaxis protein methyltransferase CheR
MNARDEGLDLERFRAAIALHLGLRFDNAKQDSLAELLIRRAQVLALEITSYLAHLEAPSPPGSELRALAHELTVPETYFFRHAAQLRAFSEVALPRRLAVRTAARPLRVLSVGCASGEEPYSLAIVMSERAVEPMRDVFIRGVDANHAMLSKAIQGRYSEWALRETPDLVRQRWFSPCGRDFLLDPAIRSAVRFEERNLAADNDDLWVPGAYDIAFCRNVLMYFTTPSAEALVGRIGRALAPGGFLFLGHAETLRGLSDDFHLRHSHGAFYYERKTPSCPRDVRTSGADRATESTSTWVDALGRASERISEMARRSLTPTAALLGSAGPPGLGEALAHLYAGRFGDALERIEAIPSMDPHVRLVLAVLLTHLGQLGRAERVCADLSQSIEYEARAHHLLALCREGQGDRAGAIHHERRAATIDPTFAMPRVHLGLLARRAGDGMTARRELETAVTLLHGERDEKVLLFGGGFGRHGLISLCQTELRRMGHAP